jgi:hypothetical protein
MGGEEFEYGIPLRNDGKEYQLDNLSEDQKDIVGYILHQIKEWDEIAYEDGEQPKPLRITLAGVAGSGKSTLINTLVSVLRKMFQSKESVKVCGPTGAAAFNAGGVTCHHCFKLPFASKESMNVSEKTVKMLRQNLNGLVCLIVDERSMVSSEVLAMMEYRARLGVNNGNNMNNSWGNIPIIILVGDDYQLPSVQSGMLHSVEREYTEYTLGQCYNEKKSVLVREGETLFHEFAKDVMYLTTSKRQSKDDQHFLDLLEKTRAASDEMTLTEEDAELLSSYHLKQNHFKASDVKKIKESPRTLFLFATNEPKDRCNQDRLYAQHSSENPVAEIKSQITNKHGVSIGRNSKHFKSNGNILDKTYLCRGAKVQLYGKNIKPEWGLFNGALGEVKDIVYKEGESPQTNDLPEYVLVHFPQYKGPAFDERDSKMVPIVPITHKCDHHCCTKTFIPLQLAYAKTIHTFQGASAGPTPGNQEDNPVLTIVCDPGTRDFKGKNTGLFYTCLSRATTMGEKGKHLTSAIFFYGDNMRPDRVMNITKAKTGYLFRKAALRKLWVANLQHNRHNSGMSDVVRTAIFEHSKNKTINVRAFLHKFET